MKLLLITYYGSILINLVLAYLFHNCQDCKTNKPLKLPLIVWITFVIITFIPVVNIISSLMLITAICVFFNDYDIKFKEGFWLAKEF